MSSSSKDASQRIRTPAQGSNDEGRTDTPKNDSIRPSLKSSGNQTSPGNHTSIQFSLTTSPARRTRKAEQLKKRKEKLEKAKSKLKETVAARSSDWSSMSSWQMQQLTAVGAKANASGEGPRVFSGRKGYSSVTPKGSPNSPFSSSIMNLSSVNSKDSKTHFRKLSKELSSKSPAGKGGGGHEGKEEDFIDISSDEEEDNLSVTEDDDQLDSEWLDLSDVEIDENQTPLVIPRKSRTERLAEKQRTRSVSSRSSTSSVNFESHKRFSSFEYHDHTYFPLKFLYVMLPIYKALLYLGRFPFEIDINGDIPVYKLNKKSWRYFLFIGTSLLSLFTSLLMISNLMSISTMAEPLTFHESILRLEQEKFWIEGTLEILNIVFVAVFSISMMEYGGGVFLVDFLNRWSQSVSIIRYDVTPGLKKMANIFFTFYGIYAVIIIVLFFAGGDTIPTVRGMCGYTGILICRTFTSELRLRPDFYAVEYFGLFVHLYTTLAGSLTTVLISMQCWALENAAERFNHRLAACLHAVGFRNPASAPPASRFVPYSKLFAEHLVITSFPGYIGETFSFGFVLYLGCKMIEMIVTLFGVAEPIVNGFHESNVTFFNVSAQSHFNPKLVVPIMIVEPINIQLIKCGIYVAKTWLPWFIFMEIVQRPGTTIIRGANLIVRNSYIKCKNTHALRFVHCFNGIFFQSQGRVFCESWSASHKVVHGKGFALSIFLTLLQFIPAEVNVQSTVICDHLGGCVRFQFPAKSRSHDGYQKTIGETISEERHKTPKPLLPPPVFEKDFHFPPCVFEGLLPVNQSVSFGFNCSHEEDSVYIPTYFKKSSNKFIQIPPTADHSCVNSSELPLNETLFDCYGDEVEVVESDECGNPRLPTADRLGNKIFPDLRVVKLNSFEIFCCYAYRGLENQAERCNRVSTEAESHKCTRKSQTEDRIKHEKSISALWNKLSDESVDKIWRELWTQCLCQGLDGIPNSASVCAASELPAVPGGPCPEYTPIKDPCKQCESDPRKMFGEHFLYMCPVQVSPVQRFLVPNPIKLVKDSKGLIKPIPWGYPCEKQTTIVDRTAEEGDYYDCFGSRVDMQNHEYKDDCGTKLLYFPDRFSGKLSTPRIKVVGLDSGPGSAFRFVCCWNYEGWQDSSVNSKCNLYPGSDLTKVCCLRSATSEAEASDTCNHRMHEDFINNKLYLEKCVNPDGKKTLTTCQNG